MKKFKIKYFIEFLIVYIISLILNLLPINFVSYIGGSCFKIFGIFTKANSTAKENYKKIFPKSNKKEILRDVSLSWQNLGKTFFELLILPKIIKNSNKMIKIEGLENIHNLSHKNNQYIFIGIHQSNWEIIVPIINKIGFNIGAIYRHINNPFINNLILNKRSKSLSDKKSFYTPKGKKSATDIIKAIRENFSVLVIVDQKDSAGEDISFFGYEVKTQTGFLKIAKKNNIKIIPVENTRLRLNNFKLKFHKPIGLDNMKKDSKEDMEKIHSIIEKWIKTNPSNWFLQHNRFN